MRLLAKILTWLVAINVIFATTPAHAGFIGQLILPIIGVAAAVLSGGTLLPLILLGASIGLSFLSQALFKPAQREPTTQMPSNQGPTTMDQKETVRQATAPRKIVYGQTRVGGVYAFLNTSPDNQILYYAILYVGHEVEELGDIWFDEEVVPLAPDGFSTHPRYMGNVYVEKHLGSNAQQASPHLIQGNPAGMWTANDRLAGIAYISGHLYWDNVAADGTLGQKVWNGALPNITVVVKGKKVYDPRSGLVAYSNNSALVVADYLCDPLYGLGVDYDTGINEEALIAAANACDELVIRGDGTQEKRYTTDGLFASDAKPDDIMGQLLGAMHGKAVYDGDRWTIYAGVYQYPSLILTDEDMRKPSKLLTLTSSRSAFNGVKGTFVGPDNKWQAADFPAVVSETYKDEDGGYELLNDIQLPFTISPGRAQRIAKIQLLKSRQEIVENFYGKLSCWRVRTGSTILRQSERYGWMLKAFEVNSTTLTIEEGDDGSPTLGVDITLSETDSTIYDWSFDEESLLDPAPNTSFPDFFNAKPPTPPFTVTESLYYTETGFRSRAHFQWGPSIDQFVERGGGYALRYRAIGDLNWTSVPTTRVTYYDADNMQPGQYEAEVRSINWTDQLSADFLSMTFEILGVFAKPSAPVNLNVVPLSGGTVAHATWDLTADIDVIMGGFIEFHHSPNLDASTVTWDQTTRISTPLPGNSTETLLPLKSGTYVAKFVDRAGVYSDEAKFVQFQSSVLEFIVVASAIEDPSFTGTKTNLNVSGGIMRLDGLSSSGTYQFANRINYGEITPARLTSYIDAVMENVTDTIDARQDFIDDWSSFDGEVAGGECDFFLEMRTTLDNPDASPVWSSWQRFQTVEAEAYAIEFRGQFITSDPSFSTAIHNLNVVAESISTALLRGRGRATSQGSASVNAVGTFTNLAATGLAQGTSSAAAASAGLGSGTITAVGQVFAEGDPFVDISGTGRIAGDLCIFVSFSGQTAPAPGNSIPAGFTLIDTHTSTGYGEGVRNTLSYKVLTGSETVLTGFGAGTDWVETAAFIFRVSGGGTWNAPSGVNVSFDMAAGASPVTINSGAGIAPLLVFGEVERLIFNNSNDYASSPAPSGTYYPGNTTSFGWNIYNSSPVNVTITPTVPGTDTLAAGFYITAGGGSAPPSSATISALAQVGGGVSSVDISGTGRAAGDLCIFVNYCGTTATPPTSAVPSGFTLIDTHGGVYSGEGATNTISYKVLDGTETTLSGFTGADWTETMALIFRKSSGSWSTPTGVDIDFNTAGTTARTIGSGSAAAPALVFGQVNRVVFNQFDDYSSSPTPSGTFYPGYATSFGWNIFNSSPANVTITPESPSNDTLTGGFYFTVS